MPVFLKKQFVAILSILFVVSVVEAGSLRNMVKKVDRKVRSQQEEIELLKLKTMQLDEALKKGDFVQNKKNGSQPGKLSRHDITYP